MKVSLLVVLLLVSASVVADEAGLKKNNCMACHAVDKKLVGPAYKAVADKYRGRSDAADKLAKKIRAGGAGVWGPIPMPAYQQISEIEAKQLADYILNLK